MTIGACHGGRPRRFRGFVLAGSLLMLAAFPALATAAPTTRAGTPLKLTGGTSPGSPVPTIPPLAATPPMGWDTWDTFGCGVNEQDIEQVANWMVLSGMRDAGYRYVIVDDCWFNPVRAADGSLRADGRKFPTGMRWLSWYLHKHGLLLGIYESAGPSTCAQLNHLYPGSTGSLGHEQQDARTFASWGVDYLKYDWCSPTGSLHDQVVGFTRMRDALRATKHPIVYSINPNSFHTATGASYDWSKIANLVRTGPDVAPLWDTSPWQNWFAGVVNALRTDAPLWKRAGPGHWNDPDILTVGVRTDPYAAVVGALGLEALLKPPLGGPQNALTFEGMRTNMAMWAMMAAPLIVGYDVRWLTREVHRMLFNKWLIEIDQDPLGIQAHPIPANDEVWTKPLSSGAVAVALLNESDDATRITTTAREVGLPKAKTYSTLNVWNGNRATTTGSLHYLVPPHGVVVYLVTPVAVAPTTAVKGRPKN